MKGSVDLALDSIREAERSSALASPIGRILKMGYSVEFVPAEDSYEARTYLRPWRDKGPRASGNTPDSAARNVLRILEHQAAPKAAP